MPSARESMADVLRHAGHEVRCCSSAVEALQPTRPLVGRCHRHRPEDARHERPGVHPRAGRTVASMRRSSWSPRMPPSPRPSMPCGTAPSTTSRSRSASTSWNNWSPARCEHGEARTARGPRSPRRQAAQGPAADAAMIGSSPRMQTLRQRIQQVAPTDETVLITGESGTGKELVARNIHLASRRRSRGAGRLQLPRPLAPTDGKRTVRTRTRRLHRSRRAARRTLRTGRSRNRPAGRNHRNRTAAAGQTAARAAGTDV